MSYWGEYIKVLLLFYSSVGLTFLIYKQRWSVFKFLKNETVESLERKLCSFDESVVAEVITDEDGIVTSINEAAEQLLGWKAVDLVNSTLEKIVPDRFWIAHSEGMKREKGKEMADNVFKVQVTRKDKTELTAELRLRKRNLNNKFYYVAVFLDKTKENQMIEHYALETNLLQKKIDILNKGEYLSCSGSWYWNLKTSKDEPDTKLYTSEGYNELLGLEDKSQFNAAYLKGNVFSEDIPIVDAALEKLFKGQAYDITYRINRRSDFKVILVRSIAKPVFDGSGMVIGVNGSTRLVQTLNVTYVTTEEYGQS